MSESERQERISARVAATVVNTCIGRDLKTIEIYGRVQAFVLAAMWEISDGRGPRTWEPSEN